MISFFVPCEFKNLFKSRSLDKRKHIFAHSDITFCLVTLSSEQSRRDRRQTLSQNMVIIPKSFYKEKSVWFHLSIKCLSQDNEKFSASLSQIKGYSYCEHSLNTKHAQLNSYAKI